MPPPTSVQNTEKLKKISIYIYILENPQPLTMAAKLLPGNKDFPPVQVGGRRPRHGRCPPSSRGRGPPPTPAWAWSTSPARNRKATPSQCSGVALQTEAVSPLPSARHHPTPAAALSPAGPLVHRAGPRPWCQPAGSGRHRENQSWGVVSWLRWEKPETAAARTGRPDERL